MSAAGIFIILNEDQRFDTPFHAFTELRTRLKNATQGKRCPEPSEVTKTHRLFIDHKWVPFVPIASDYTRVAPTADLRSLGTAPTTIEFTFPALGCFTSDIVLHLRIAACGTADATPSQTTPYYRYCAYPGLKVVQRVAFKSDKCVIDEYTRDSAVAYMKYGVTYDRRAGWDRCMGQQEVQQAPFFANGHTQYMQYADGAQTPKTRQPALDLFIPLQFWFCLDPAHALVNDLMPSTQRTVEVTLAPLTEILKAFYPDPLNASQMIDTSLGFTKLGCATALYVNNLWVTPDIHEIYVRSLKFNVVRVHRQQTTRIVNPKDELLLNSIRFPTEFIFAGARSLNNARDFDQWWLMGKAVSRTNPATKLYVPAYVWNPSISSVQLVAREAREVTSLKSFIASMTVVSETIPLFPTLHSKFYNAYIPLRYEDTKNLVTPLDEASVMINFSLLPRSDQPTGYINLSSARNNRLMYEVDPEYEADVVNNAEWVLCAWCLNFIIIRGDSLALRYTI